MATKLKGYRFVRGSSPSKKDSHVMVDWIRWDFIFATVDGGEEVVSCFPRNAGMLARLIGREDSEIINREDLPQNQR